MRTQLIDNLFIADLESGHPEGTGAAIVHACKTPCHQNALRYEGSLPSTDPNYLFFEGDLDLFLNIIDPKEPLFKIEVFDKALEFIDKHIKNREVIIHCNQGLSRAPALAMLFLFRDKSFDEAMNSMRDMFPQFAPNTGIQTFLREHWDHFKPANKVVKLHLGCGDIYLEGYVNVDMHESAKIKIDLKHDLGSPLPYPDNSVDLIQAYHLFEHLKFSSIEAIIKDWYRVMKSGARIIMEMPDFDETLKYVLANPNDNAAIASIYGSQEHEGQYHHWGWNKTRLKLLLEGVGFKDIQFPEPKDYHTQLEPCMRVEAVK